MEESREAAEGSLHLGPVIGGRLEVTRSSILTVSRGANSSIDLKLFLRIQMIVDQPDFQMISL
jgi:hypothetical protein